MFSSENLRSKKFSPHIINFLFLLIFSIFSHNVLCTPFDENYSLDYIQRFKRQDKGEGKLESESRSLICDFNYGDIIDECSWVHPEDEHPNVRWKKGQGAMAYWIGGPLKDYSHKDEKGK